MLQPKSNIAFKLNTVFKMKLTIEAVGWSGHSLISLTPQLGTSNTPDVVNFFLIIMSAISINLSVDLNWVDLQQSQPFAVINRR